MKKLFYFIFLLPPCTSGASNGSGEYDIVSRTVGLLVFVAILYYFVADSFETLYKNGTLRTSLGPDETQKKLLESKAKELDTVKKFEETKVNAAAALVVAKKEAEVLVQKIKEETRSELALLQKHSEKQKGYEFRKMEKEVASLTLKEIFEDSSIALKQNEIIDTIMRKVS